MILLKLVIRLKIATNKYFYDYDSFYLKISCVNNFSSMRIFFSMAFIICTLIRISIIYLAMPKWQHSKERKLLVKPINASNKVYTVENNEDQTKTMTIENH